MNITITRTTWNEINEELVKNLREEVENTIIKSIKSNETMLRAMKTGYANDHAINLVIYQSSNIARIITRAKRLARDLLYQRLRENLNFTFSGECCGKVFTEIDIDITYTLRYNIYRQEKKNWEKIATDIIYEFARDIISKKMLKF